MWEGVREKADGLNKIYSITWKVNMWNNQLTLF